MDLETLRPIFLFDGLTDEQLLELLDDAEAVDFAEGDELFRQGELADSWWVLIEGRVDLLRRSGREQTVVNTMERAGVWAGGFRAWADDVGYLSTGRAASAGRIMRIPAAVLGARTQAWFPFGVHMIKGFFQTVRNIEAASHEREALVALGTLAAGLAHELNNPAAATARAVDSLQDTCNALLEALVDLAERAFTAEQFVALEQLRRELDPAQASADPLMLADREEELLNWLEARGVESSWRIAPDLARAGVTLAWCERASDVLDLGTIGPAFDWIAGTLLTAELLAEVKESTARVSALVAAVKSYSQLDRASRQVIDVTEGIESTLTMLGHKIPTSVTIERAYSTDVPRIEANPGELNQVWTNLIDNAIDAMDGAGTLRISTRVGSDHIVIEVADTGSGMPADVQHHAFEPFFTTKDVGKGTGLGLDISRRIVVDRHHGTIAIDSRPGATVLRVALPLEQTT